jgi:hypothetical protein
VPTITGHAGLAGNTSGDDNDLSALESVCETRGSSLMAGNLLRVSGGVWRVGDWDRRIVPRSWC